MQNRLKVLVVDDEPNIVLTLTAILELGGFETYGAYSERTAILTARDFSVDVLLTDVMMPPGKTGVELAAEVEVFLPDCKIILFSGEPDKAKVLAQRYRGWERWELLSKPVSPETLLSKLRDLVPTLDSSRIA